ncbi:hypothetical protein LSAT2_009030 [Lamellibrachia satsuma]|nr:hypothetical protein LSAT2_009030 [Lamellibrachia satsuma]
MYVYGFDRKPFLRNNRDLFRQEEDVERLCNGLAGMEQLKILDLSRTGLTDAGLTRVCQTVTKHCRQLTHLVCTNNPGLAGDVEDVVGQTMRDLSGLTINLLGCRLSPDVRRRLRDEFGQRFYVNLLLRLQLHLR